MATATSSKSGASTAANDSTPQPITNTGTASSSSASGASTTVAAPAAGDAANLSAKAPEETKARVHSLLLELKNAFEDLEADIEGEISSIRAKL